MTVFPLWAAPAGSSTALPSGVQADPRGSAIERVGNECGGRHEKYSLTRLPGRNMVEFED